VTSILAAALGPDFDRLHPMLQRRFGVGLDAGYACVGTGVMTSIRRGPWWTLPFLYLGAVRNILIPDVGRDVPFVIMNYPYRDPYGRETITFVRQYQMHRRHQMHRRLRRFDATMINDRGRVIDYLGTHQHLAVDLALAVLEDGSLHITTGAQRLYEGLIGFRFPMLFSGTAELYETYDDTAEVYRVRMEVRNRVFGFLFGYEGHFRCEFPGAGPVPAGLIPVRHERRV